MTRLSELMVLAAITFLVGAIMMTGVLTIAPVYAEEVPPPPPDGDDSCVTIQDGVLIYSPGHYLAGELLRTGFDPYGYNYQARAFNGFYANAYLGRDGFPPYQGEADEYLAENPTAVSHWTWAYRDVKLQMKWNDAWLSNKDCTGDGQLDRHYGFVGYLDSGAWLTNHMQGGEKKDKWTYFVKIVSASTDGDVVGGVWYNMEGVEVGPAIWGEFAIIQEIDNELHSRYISPSGPGLGKF